MSVTCTCVIGIGAPARGPREKWLQHARCILDKCWVGLGEFANVVNEYSIDGVTYLFRSFGGGVSICVPIESCGFIYDRVPTR